MTEKNESHQRSSRGLFLNWAGVLVAPTAWALHMQTNYSLVPWVCRNGGELYLHLVTTGALLVTVAGGVAAWLVWSEGGKEEESNGGGDTLSRARFMGALGLLTSAMFFLLIIAQAVPSFIFSTCQR